MPSTSQTDSPILLALKNAPGCSASTPAVKKTKAKAKSKAEPEASAQFSAEGQLALDALTLTVHGQQSPLGQPVSAEAASALHQASTPARHGRRDATLLDKSVRDTGEIAADALDLQWRDGALPALLEEVARALGVQRLQARVHNLLVYGPGQFFKPHQDTEKHPGMVATLVLVWPSPHIGGLLRVQHGEARQDFASQHLQAQALHWFAFYTDCRHEVLPVAEGWRIVLSLDLLVPADASLAPQAPVDAPLLAALREHFHPNGGVHAKPWAFFLDHEYTEHGLRWPLLKGADRPRVAALRAAAEALGLSMHLALAEIHENWTAIEPYSGRRGNSDPEPDELIDQEVRLDFWVDASNTPLSREALRLEIEDTASFSDTDETFLTNQEYEGYTGNEGQTLDYWYRRAALVLQTPLAHEVNRFITDFDAALADAQALARRPGSGEELARRLLAAERPLQGQRARHGQSLFPVYAELALALPDARQAHTLCAEFVWAEFQVDNASMLARLAQQRGVPWLRALLDAWARDSYLAQWTTWKNLPADEVQLWPQSLEKFIQACVRAKLPGELIDAMLDHCQAALTRADEALLQGSPVLRQGSLVLRQASPAVRQATWPRRLQALCELVAATLQSPQQAQRRIAQLLDMVRTRPALYPLHALAPLWRSLPSDAPQPEEQTLRAAVVQALRQALAAPEFNDHRLNDVQWTCRCADCKPVIHWAIAPGTQPLTLAMSEARRRHVQEQLDAAGAQVATRTLRQGSPHKLVLTKSEDVPTKRRAQREALEKDLAALA